MEGLKERLEILVAKDAGDDVYCQLLLELILQVAKLNKTLEGGIVVYEGGEAEDVVEEGDTNEAPF
jgi:hypothetical protein